MWIYIIIFLELILMVLLSQKKDSRIPDVLGLISLILLAGLRFNTGFDIQNYRLIYNGFMKTGQVEVGFVWLSKFANWLGMPFELFIFLWACMSLTILYLAISHYFQPGIIPIMYYFSRFYFLRDMGQIRSAMAAAICLYSIKSIQERHFFRFLWIILVASTIHSAALLFLFIYPFVCLMQSRLQLKYLIGSILVTSLIGFFLMSPVMQLVAHLSPRYAPYINNQIYVSHNPISAVTILQIVILVVAVITIKRHLISETDRPKVEIMTTIYWFSTLILLLLPRLTTVAGRLATLPATVEIILVPLLVFTIVPRNLRIWVIIGVSILFFYLIFISSGSYLHYIPYRTIFGGL